MGLKARRASYQSCGGLCPLVQDGQSVKLATHLCREYGGVHTHIQPPLPPSVLVVVLWQGHESLGHFNFAAKDPGMTIWRTLWLIISPSVASNYVIINA
jgi:hypothetical protein